MVGLNRTRSTRAGLKVAYPRLAHDHRTNAGHDLALGQMAVAHHAPAARVCLEIAMSVQKISDLRLDRLRQQGARPVAQNLGERIGEGPWLRKLDDVIIGHGVSLVWLPPVMQEGFPGRERMIECGLVSGLLTRCFANHWPAW
jgi:hypothetical protein